MRLGDMFFEFVSVKAEGEEFRLSKGCRVSGVEGYAKKYVRSVLDGLRDDGRVMDVVLTLGIPAHIAESVPSEEAYALEISDTVRLYGASPRGLIYAVSTLRQLIEADRVRRMVLYDYPSKSLRGYRVFTPGREQFDAFYRMVDMLVYYKYNTINLEIGGAMEYKRHPVINEKWVEFCEEVHQSPYEAERIQKKTHTAWQKNSIHADNGGGGFITQEEMRGLIAYCRECGIEVIPEVPTLSHCDYIVRAYPELNERVEDTYPDTYCPSNPKSYEIVFDILDEVVEVFAPEYVNIGHDECYTLAKCDKCRGKDPVSLYVEDVTRINDYLKGKGIKSIMWGEKVYDNVFLPDEGGVMRGYGGTGEPAWDVPRLCDCAGRLPKDVTLMQWYWSLCSGQDEARICDMGYSMIYGNFSAIKLKDYRERIARVRGGFVSNWGSFEEQYMQRNGQNFALCSTAWIFWSHTYDSEMAEELKERVKAELYGRYRKTLARDVIELWHTTGHARPYKAFYDGYYIVEEDWTLGCHRVTYTDKTVARLPVIYGLNIGCCYAGDNSEYVSEEAKATSDIEVIGASYPEYADGKVWYKTAWNNPYPEKEIESIVFEAKDGIAVELK